MLCYKEQDKGFGVFRTKDVVNLAEQQGQEHTETPGVNDVCDFELGVDQSIAECSCYPFLFHCLYI